MEFSLQQSAGETNGTKYSRMDQIQFVKDNLKFEGMGYGIHIF